MSKTAIAAPSDLGGDRKQLLIRLDSLLWWVLEEKIIVLQNRTYRRAHRRAQRRLERRRDAYFECRTEFGAQSWLTEHHWHLAVQAQALEDRLSEQTGLLIIGNEEHWPWGIQRKRI